MSVLHTLQLNERPSTSICFLQPISSSWRRYLFPISIRARGEGNLTPQSWSRKHLMEDGAKKTEFLERTRLTPVCLLALLASNRVLTMSALLSLLATSGCNSIDTQDERGDSEAGAIDGCGWWESGQCWIWNPRLISTDQLSVILCLPRLMLLTTRARFQP